MNENNQIKGKVEAKNKNKKRNLFFSGFCREYECKEVDLLNFRQLILKEESTSQENGLIIINLLCTALIKY